MTIVFYLFSRYVFEDYASFDRNFIFKYLFNYKI